ncbi:alpha/beta hydrolase [Planctomonas sp. JC2975]|uniref:alpha/beta hydrolase n=1 Tax=Planctomonas sp. JC2975 TaxID=2729626 RepID=UPI001473A9FC|nr:alpha/beta hydrolase [Planctomonas sp. JC2975]NNC11340.1 alpha/beta hydrolase [Planctomonas sp. JC2975]
MSAQQRIELDAQLRFTPQPAGPATIEQARAGFAAFMGQFPVPAGVRSTTAMLGGRRAVVVEAEQHVRPGTILYFHGGSFSQGSPETAMAVTANLVVRTGMRAVSVDYRLAPEHPFPAAIDDGVAAYRSLLENGADASTVAFAGDSAGGGLAVTVSLAARDAGLLLPAAIVAFSPGLDHTRTGASMRIKEGVDPFFTFAGLERNGDLYLNGQDARQPLATPAVYADLTGFPPILLQVGTNELLLDDSVRLADRAREAGVDVILDVTANVPHVFQAWAGVLDEADHALDRAALFLTQRVAAATDPGSSGLGTTPARRVR